MRHGNLDPRRRGVAPIIRAFNGDTVNTAVPPTRALRPQAQSQLPCDLAIRSAAHQLAFGHHAERRRFERSLTCTLTRDANRIPDDFFESLHRVFNDREIVELTFHIGSITMLNRFNHALRVRYMSAYK